MRKLRKIEKSELFEVIVPFGGEESESGLFDDCPLCLELRRAMGRGEVESVPIQVEIDEND